MAVTDTVVLLYTSDMHDHLRARAGGVGGVPFVSGYINKVRNERSDVVLVDAGDVVNKGDMLPFRTRGKTMYEAMKRIGYTATAPGNHGFVYGLAQLLKNVDTAGFPVLCANVQQNDGSDLPLKRSVVVDADGVKVGIIGYTLPGAKFAAAKCSAFDLKRTAAVLNEEAEKLAPQVHMIVAVGHCSNQNCLKMAPLAPGIDVFVAAHNHQILNKPKKAPDTGALVVQAGANALHVGHLELTVDLATKEITAHKNKVVKLVHKSVPEDEAMSSWVDGTEKAVCPEAREALGTTAEAVTKDTVGTLYARAIRKKAGADIALVNRKRILGGFVAGQGIDVNAVFATYMMEFPKVSVVELAGSDLARALGKFKNVKSAPAWDGFAGRLDPGAPAGKRLVDSDLEPERAYSVAINDGLENPGGLPRAFGFTAPKTGVTTCDFTPVDALSAHIRSVTAEGKEIGRAR